MKKLAVILTALAVVGMGSMQAWGQVEVEWAQEYGSQETNTYIFSSEESPDDGFILVGMSQHIQQGIPEEKHYALAIQVDTDGNAIWSHEYDSGKDVCQFLSVVNVETGFLFAGLARNRDGALQEDIYLVRTDSVGNELWSRVLEQEGHQVGMRMISNAAGGFTIVGLGDQEGGQGVHDVLVLALSSEGDIIWQNLYGGGNEEQGISLFQDEEENYVVAGYTQSFGAGDYDGYILKLSSDGQLIWSQTVGSEQYDTAFDIIPSGDGNYLVVGTTVLGRGVQGDPFLYYFSAAKLSSAGEVIWTQRYGNNQRGWVGRNGRQVTRVDEGFILSGIGCLDGTTIAFTTTRINNNGDELWSSDLRVRPNNEFAYYNHYDAHLFFKNRSYYISGTFSPVDGSHQMGGLLKTTPDPTPTLFNVPEDCETIQQAINWATDGDTILVADGNYAERLQITKSITIVGNTEAPENVTIDPGNMGTIVSVPSEVRTSLIGCTIANGISDGDASGIICEAGSQLTLTNVILRDQQGGPVIYAWNADVTIRNCSFLGNLDGAIRVSGESLHVYDSDFSNNAGYCCWNGPGGSDIRFDGCVMQNNDLREFPCVIASLGSDGDAEIALHNTLITNNNDGGLISLGHGNQNIHLNIENCTIVDNRLAGNSPYTITFDGVADDQVRVHNSILRNGEREMFVTGDVVLEVNYSNIQNGYAGNGNISSDPLFFDPDNGDFHLTRESPCIDAGDPESELDPDGTVADMGAYYAQQTFHRIPLRRGWNMMSSFNPARNPSIRTVFADLVARGNLIRVKDQAGRFYSPPSNNFSNMESFDVRQGYQAKLAEDDTLVIVNIPTPVETPIPLRQGWNIAAYFPEAELTAAEAFTNLEGSLDMVKDEAGRFYRPAIGFSNMGTLSRGKGYQIKVTQDVELVYPAGQRQMENGKGKMENEAHSVHPVHFVTSEPTGANMSLLIADCGLKIAEGGEIGVFTEAGLCVGSTDLRVGNSGHSTSLTDTEVGATRVGLAVWGDDPTTPEVDGAVEGEALSFEVWDGRVRRPVLLKWTEGEAVYRTDGFAAGEVDLRQAGMPVLPSAYTLHSTYPNPFNSTTTIQFALPEDSRMRLAVYDLSGREVAVLVEGELKAGNHSSVWNAEGFTSGIYLVKMETPAFSSTRKVTLIR